MNHDFLMEVKDGDIIFNGSKERKKTPKKGVIFLGALSGTRTLGPLIKSQLLYQLS